MTFIEWFSVISFVFNIGLLIWGVYQLLDSRRLKELNLREKDRHQAQVKIWQHFASGLSHALGQMTGQWTAEQKSKT